MGGLQKGRSRIPPQLKEVVGSCVYFDEQYVYTIRILVIEITHIYKYIWLPKSQKESICVGNMDCIYFEKNQ